ncbi:MAG: KamA family radical SAM protein [Methanomicrobiales archaeon]|nr:KamA family radical SAM protein [Methanomicrobiales archaeon]NYT21575.1 KamA family radical SAM protein [Methanomicrobiales archaeon]
MAETAGSPRYVHELRRVRGIREEERNRLEAVEEKFAFRSNEYYLSLIDWEDPDDPIRRIVIPDPEELERWGKLDASEEVDYTIAPGLQHKYDQTALLLLSDQCGGFCRFCFRKRLFMEHGREVVRDISADIAYIRDHPEITNVLLTGGDPFFLSTRKLAAVIGTIREIDHVRIIRIGSKIPAYNPYRIINDPALLEMIRTHSTAERRIYVMAQFNHPREITPVARKGLDLLRDAGAILANQTPILRGINDDPAVLAELLRELSFIGVAPYYLFQCRPTLGNHHFAVPVEEAYLIIEEAKKNCSGLAKRPNFVMSHKTGKIAIVGLDEEHVYFRYHQAAEYDDIGKFMAFKRNPVALWFDDYRDPVREMRV